MIYDFHTHTFFSDGENSPVELARFAAASGYKCIGFTDHASYSNIDELIENVTKDCKLISKYWDIIAIPGVEITNVPAGSIDEMAKYAKENGARLVIAHGESIVEKVEKGTNLVAVKSKHVDILAHPGFITEKEIELAIKNDIYIEITKRAGHSLTNGLVAKLGLKYGAKFLVNSDAHNANDLFSEGWQEKIALAAGLTKKQTEEIFSTNNKSLLKKLGY